MSRTHVWSEWRALAGRCRVCLPAIDQRSLATAAAFVLPSSPAPAPHCISVCATLCNCTLSPRFRWRMWHRRSYNLVTLLGLWLIPCALCVYAQSWRFVCVWSLYTAGTLWHIRLARAVPLDKSTPRQDLVSIAPFGVGCGAALWQ